MSHRENARYQREWRERRENRLQELETQVKELQAELKRRTDGSLFDLAQSTPPEIYDVIKGTMSKSRFAKLKALFQDKPKAPRKSKPAG